MAFVAGQILTASALNGILTSGTWTPYTPTWTGVTVGNATQATSYFVAGKLVIMRLRFIFGSTSSFTGNPLFSLPVTANANTYGGGMVATYRDVSAGADYDGFIRLAGTANGWPELKNSAGANDGRTLLTSTTPFTWATGDILDGYLTYESA